MDKNCENLPTTMQQKLEMMTTSPSGGAKAEEVVEAEAARDKPTGRPGAILDSCLARARTLHIKMDKLSAEVSARREPGHPKLPADTDQPGGQVSSDKASNLELARDTSATRKVEKHQSFVTTEPAAKLQTAGAMPAKTLQVKVQSHNTLNTADSLPIGNVTSKSHPAWTEVQPTGSVRQPHALQVKYDEHDALDTHH